MSYSASLISGKAGSATTGGIAGGSKIILTTSETNAETYRGARLNFYYAFNCDSDTCEYSKAGQIKPNTKNTTYELDLPVMNFASDRLIMDTRDGTWTLITDLKLSAGGTVYDLLDFKIAERSSKLGSFYSRYVSNHIRSPCADTRSNCFYDLIFDINSKTVSTEKPLIEGI